METSITSETTSQQTICAELQKPSKDCEYIEIAKKSHGHLKMIMSLIRLKVRNILLKLIKLREIYLGQGKFTLITFPLRKWLIASSQYGQRQQRGMTKLPPLQMERCPQAPAKKRRRQDDSNQVPGPYKKYASSRN